ncbi:MAG: site-2 protease family protein, partial [Mogibacterium sp.]|nr:site-2 protease family protein [Mogibacterium sp.]
GVKTGSWEAVADQISANEDGKTMTVTYERDGKTAETSVTPYYDEERGGYMIGIMAGTTKNIWTCLRYAPSTTWELNKSIIMSFKMIFSGKVSADDVAGPVGLVKVVGVAADYGIAPYLMLLALVSLNLALFNLLPIPGLDGGKIFFIFLKIISGGRINDDMEYKATLAGLVLLLTLFALVTVNDVMNLFK